MSDVFKDREKGFERKYQLDQEQAFKVQSRRDKLFGQWVAAQLGKAGADAEAYAKELVAANMDLPGDEDMLDKARSDLKAKNVSIDDKVLYAQLNQAEAEAAREIIGAKN
jgi:hypothetical protein